MSCIKENHAQTAHETAREAKVAESAKIVAKAEKWKRAEEAAYKEKEIKSDGKLSEFIASMIAKAGAADKVGSLAKREMEKHGLTYDDVMAGKR